MSELATVRPASARQPDLSWRQTDPTQTCAVRSSPSRRRSGVKRLPCDSIYREGTASQARTPVQHCAFPSPIIF